MGLWGQGFDRCWRFVCLNYTRAFGDAKDVEEYEEDDTEKNQSLADTNAVTQIWRLNSCGLRIELAVPKKLMVLAQVSQSIRFRILCGSALPGL